MPAAALDASAPGMLRSSTTTLAPALASASALAHPITPPPTMTTSPPTGIGLASFSRRLFFGSLVLALGCDPLGGDARSRTDGRRMPVNELGAPRSVDGLSFGGRIDGGLRRWRDGAR